jgi:Domain of unknown function (DUF4129)
VDERERGGDGPGPSRARTVAILAAALAGLLWVVAVASRNERPDAAGPARGPLVASPRLLVSFYGVVLVVGLAQLALLANQAWRRRGLERRRRAPWRGLVWVGVLLLVCAVLAGLHFPDWANLGAKGGGGRGGRPAPTAPAAGRPGVAQTPRVLGLEALAFAGAVTALALLLAARRRRQAGAGPAGVAGELSAAIERSLDELRGERDPRQAVIAAYAGMEHALAVHGVPRAPAEAPLEYLARVLVDLRVAAGSAHRLTDLFERAKFSDHPVDEAMKRDAIDALAAVRDDLEGVAA